MLRESVHRLVICASHLKRAAVFAFVVCGLVLEGDLSAATVPAGFTESQIPGGWTDAVGLTFESNGRMYVWERTGRVWFKDPGSSVSLLLDISEEVGAWEDHGM